jgi:hypothetical protein
VTQVTGELPEMPKLPKSPKLKTGTLKATHLVCVHPRGDKEFYLF